MIFFKIDLYMLILFSNLDQVSNKEIMLKICIFQKIIKNLNVFENAKLYLKLKAEYVFF